MKKYLLIFPSIVCLAFSGFAQDAPKEIFANSFVTDPDQFESRAAILPEESAASPQPEAAPGNKPIEPAAGKNAAKSLAIHKIHLISDGKDQTHLFRNMSQFTSTFLNYKITPGIFYVTGLTNLQPTDAPLDWVKIVSHGGIIEANYEIAKQFRVQLSPSWILETDQGPAILEGFEDIQKFLTSDGRLHARYITNKEMIHEQ